MNNATITANVTMGQLQRKLDTVAHNIANSNTTGYKSREVHFADLLYQQMNNQSRTNQEVGRLTPPGLRRGSGAGISQVQVSFNKGSIQQTDRTLDFAISADSHFFTIESAETGEHYLTRDGSFYLSEDPNDPEQLLLVTSQGDSVLDRDGSAISIPLTFSSIELRSTGDLMVQQNDGTEISAGELGLIHIHKPQLLQSLGQNGFRLPDLAQLGYTEDEIQTIVAANETRVVQRALEGSNVDVGEQMNDLLMTQRHFQLNARAISIADEMTGLVNGIRG